MRFKKNYVITAALLLTLVAFGSVEKSDLAVKKIAKYVSIALPFHHLNQLPLDEHISTNTFNLFIESLDPAKSYFLQSDIDEFQKQSNTLNKLLKAGDISFAMTTFDVLMERVHNRMDYVDELLEKGFDLEKKETFQWNREDAAWPKDEAEWNELWRKRIKHEYVARLVSKQVYADNEEAEAQLDPEVEIPAVDASETNALASSTNTVDDVYDEDTELADLTPEEFIKERYKQYLLTMESFDEEMLLQRYLTSFSLVYDPHSDYMSPSSLEDFNINMKLSLVGIGAMLRPDDGSAKIVELIPGGPADQDGRLKPGDKIIAVGDGKKQPTSILHWPLYKAVRLIRGEINTPVELTIIPASDRSESITKKIVIIRDEVKLEDKEAKSEVRELTLDDGITRKLGVITLPDFYADFGSINKHQKDAKRCSVDVKQEINNLLKENIEGLVLDLRNNGGGSLLEAIEIAGLFIPSGPVVQVKDQRGVQVLPDADPDMEYKGPMVVLVNRLSASASEILAAALQDYDRAIIVGDRQTHGKGTVQTLIQIPGKRTGSLKVTTAGFYRINGGSTQLKGVTPDIIIPSYLDVMDIGEDSLEHALPWDEVRSAGYSTLDNFQAFIPTLAEQSKERLDHNSDFEALLAKRARLKARYDTKTVSLSLEERLIEAEAEKELDDIQDGSFLDDGDEDAQKADITLDESLHILVDLIDLKKIQETTIPPILSARADTANK